MVYFVPTPLNSQQRFFRALSIVVLALSLCACVGEKQSLIWDTFKLGILGNDSLINQAELNPNYQYLRAEVNGNPALLVLGYENTKAGSTVETWYSSSKEVLQLEGGRLAGTGGLDTNWTDVSLMDAPAITSPELFPSDAGSTVKGRRNPKLFFFRIRSVMPQYLVNIREAVVMQGLKEAPEDAPKVLRDPANNINLRWVQESVVLQPNNPSVPTLKAIYAYDKATNKIIFGRQCLSEKECLSWLIWPYPLAQVRAVR